MSNWYKIALRQIFNPSSDTISKIDKWYYEDNLSFKQIAKNLDTNDKNIGHWFEKTNRQKRENPNKSKDIQQNIDEILLLYNQGKTMLDIARVFKVSPTAIRYLFIKNNIQIRPQDYISYRTEDYKKRISKKLKQYWESRDWWSELAKYPLEKRFQIINAMIRANSKNIPEDKILDNINRMMNKARSLDDNPQNPHLTPIIHSPYATGNELSNNIT
jgi:hypothetical protein